MLLATSVALGVSVTVSVADEVNPGSMTRISYSASAGRPARAAQAYPEQLTDGSWNCQYPSPGREHLILTCSKADKLDVPLGLGGSLTSPNVSVRAGEAVQGLLKGQVEQVKKSAQQEAEKAGKKALEGIFDRFKK